MIKFLDKTRLISYLGHRFIFPNKFTRFMSSEATNTIGACIAAFRNSKESQFELSEIGKKLDEESNGAIKKQINCINNKEAGSSRLIYGAHDKYKIIAINFIENVCQKESENERMNLSRESIRSAVGDAVGKLKREKISKIFVDSSYEPFVTAEAAYLKNYNFDVFKAKKEISCDLKQIENISSEAWDIGKVYAESQNFARYLTELPANHLYPSHFASLIEKEFSNVENCRVIIHDEKWIREKKMLCLMAVSIGSHYSPRFVEIHYNGKSGKDIDCLLIGKGITFDTGGVSLKPAASMGDMRGDMGGAAAIVSTMRAITKLSPKMNVSAFIPICENAVGGGATRPSDVAVACNGKSVQIDNTDAEGRLILADALAYASMNYTPDLLVTAATLTGAIGVALGPACTGAYTSSDFHWESLQKASYVTGDRVWRMPHFECYSKQMKECLLADINNISGSRSGGANCAAAFLREFNENKSIPYLHLDIAAVAMSNETQTKYISKGMTGRPTRTMIEFLTNLAA